MYWDTFSFDLEHIEIWGSANWICRSWIIIVIIIPEPPVSYNIHTSQRKGPGPGFERREKEKKKAEKRWISTIIIFFWCHGVEGGLVKKFILTVFRQEKVVKRPFSFLSFSLLAPLPQWKIHSSGFSFPTNEKPVWYDRSYPLFCRKV